MRATAHTEKGRCGSPLKTGECGQLASGEGQLLTETRSLRNKTLQCQQSRIQSSSLETEKPDLMSMSRSDSYPGDGFLLIKLMRDEYVNQNANILTYSEKPRIT